MYHTMLLNTEFDVITQYTVYALLSAEHWTARAFSRWVTNLRPADEKYSDEMSTET